MRRTARLFAITEYLRSRRTGVTAEILAERFEVGIRTIYRDLDALKGAELPLRADRGRGGGYALDRAYSLPPVNFTAREAALLVALGEWMTEMRVIPFVDTIKSAMDKVRAALSSSAQRDLIERLESLKFVGVPAHATSPAVRHALEQAWFERLPLRIRYRGKEGPAAWRNVRLTSVVMERTETLLNCDDLDKREPRQFLLARVEAAVVVTPREAE
jgi:predicted DNA-binding transcriptional regulator YafY